MTRVFVSYAHEDEKVAHRLHTDLIDHGIAAWLDSVDLLPGQDWKRAIGEAIKASSHFLALISERSVNKNGFVQKELRIALDVLDEVPPNQIYLIPVRIDNTRPAHERLASLQWVDLSPSYDKAFNKILLSLGSSPTVDRSTCRRIIASIDPSGSLKDGSDSTVKELTKRLLFYIVRELFCFPFDSYRQFIDWLREEGYTISGEHMFLDDELYQRSLTKVERLNRVGIPPDRVDASLMFSKKRPFVRIDER